jgi:hypothetical protein
MIQVLFKVREINGDVVPNNGTLVLLTMRDVVDRAPLYITDFRDTHTLVFSKTGNFVGLTKSRGVRLGKRPLRMVDGIWYAVEDFDAQKVYKNVELRAEHLILNIIR